MHKVRMAWTSVGLVERVRRNQTQGSMMDWMSSEREIEESVVTPKFCFEQMGG